MAEFPPMTRVGLLAGCLACGIALALPTLGAAQEQDPAAASVSDATAEAAGDGAQRGPVPPAPAPADMKLRVEGASRHTVNVGKRVKAIARLKPFVPNQEITFMVTHHGKTLKKRKLRVRQIGNRDVGKASMPSPHFVKPGHYTVRAFHEATPEQEAADKEFSFHITYPDLHPGSHGDAVQIFNRLLRRQGYYVTVGKGYGDATKRAVMAFRKVNRMPRKWDANPSIFRTLADGKGTFRLKYPGRGRHVEVDISRQVMVLADNGRAQHIFHVSTGAPSTPTIRGHFRFYRKDAGFNSIGMYYSVYFIRGYATHGYHSVPPYNASHGCVRNPIPNSRFIYNWINLGMSIWTYG